MPEDGGDGFEYMSAAARVCEKFSAPDVDTLGMGGMLGAAAMGQARLKADADAAPIDGAA